MARLSTHVLDTANGRPAAGVRIELRSGGVVRQTAATNADGRADFGEVEAGVYEFVFRIGDYFGNTDGFLREVVVRFGVADAAGRYHVPLLVSPYGYTTYRGS